MSKPYNFLGSSGAIYPDLYSGAYTPTGMFDTPLYYQWRLDQDLYEQKPQLSINLSGTKEGGAGFSVYNQSFIFSGQLIGLKSGFADLNSSFTGQQNNAKIARGDLITSFSGNQNSHLNEKNNLNLRVTGSQRGQFVDYNTINVSLSGDNNGCLIDLNNLNCNLTGNIIKADRDLISLNVTFSGVEWDVYRPRIKRTIEPDSTEMSVSLIRIVWSRAGG